MSMQLFIVWGVPILSWLLLVILTYILISSVWGNGTATDAD